MKTTFKKSETNFGCYSADQVKAAKLKANFTIADVLNANVRLQDKAWFIRNNCEFTTDEYRQFAIGCALCVLPIYEAKHPGNNAPRKAIEAAQAYLAGTIGLEELREARHAAAAAAAYAAAAAAAAAAAYAAAATDADAAAAAAYAAAAAAAAAAYAAAATDADAAAAAAAYAAADAEPPIGYKDLLLNFFKEFTAKK